MIFKKKDRRRTVESSTQDIENNGPSSSTGLNRNLESFGRESHSEDIEEDYEAFYI